jgi:hypothetical protein
MAAYVAARVAPWFWAGDDDRVEWPIAADCALLMPSAGGESGGGATSAVAVGGSGGGGGAAFRSSFELATEGFLSLQPSVQLGMARGYEKMSAAFKDFLAGKAREGGGAPVTLTKADVEAFFEGFKRAQQEEQEAQLREAAKNG